MRSLRGTPVLLAAIWTLSVATTPAAGRAVGRQSPGPRWCGASTSEDEVCPQRGALVVTAAAGARFRVARGPHAVEPKSTLNITSGGEAHVNFGQEVLCALGIRDSETEIVTRFGPIANPLFEQVSGESECTFAKGSRRELGFFCTQTGHATCPVVVSTGGLTQVITLKPKRSASSSAYLAKALEGPGPRVVMEFCAGAFAIRAGTPPNYAEASGVVGPFERERAEVEESVEEELVSTPTETRISLASHFGVSVEALPSRGPCRSPAFTQQRARLGTGH